MCVCVCVCMCVCVYEGVCGNKKRNTEYLCSGGAMEGFSSGGEVLGSGISEDTKKLVVRIWRDVMVCTELLFALSHSYPHSHTPTHTPTYARTHPPS